MAAPYHHAVSSAKRWGGEWTKFVAIHDRFDNTKSHHGDFRHRALRHHAQGVFECEETFGRTLTLFSRRTIPVRWVAEQHVVEDMGRIPTLGDWLSCLKPAPWMMRSRAPQRGAGGPGGVTPAPGGRKNRGHGPFDPCPLSTEEVNAMANYEGRARSNYFRVREETAFLEWVGTLPGVVARGDGAAPGRFALLVEDGEGGGWPNRSFDGEEEIDIHAGLAGHLAEGEVAVLEEVGSEKLRYLVGYAVAVNHRGETISVSLDAVYARVREAGWGSDVSTATY